MAIGHVQAAVRPVRVKAPQHPERGQGREALAEALHPPALVIHGDQQGPAGAFANRRAQFLQLLRSRVIAREQHHSTDRRVPQRLHIRGGKLGGGQAYQDRAE